jgi:hypothetical protein
MSPRTFAPRSWRAAAASLALALAAACGDDSPVAPKPVPVRTPVASVQVAADVTELPIGRTRQLTAVVRASDGRALSGRAVAWSSSDPRVASVDEGGVVTTREPGEVIIRAESEGKAASARLTVRARTVATIRPAVERLSLEAGAAAHVVVTLLDDAGLAMPNHPVQFRSEDASIAAVEATGRVVALRSGVTHVVVTADAQSIRVRVDVTARPAAPRMAGVWQVVIEDLVGTNTRCTVEGLQFSITQDGELLGGEVLGANGGPRVGCEITGGQPPFTTPLPPVGQISGRVTRDGDGAVVTIQTQNGWSFSGLMRDGVFAGLAANDARVGERFETRRGEIYAVQLNQR